MTYRIEAISMSLSDLRGHSPTNWHGTSRGPSVVAEVL